MDKDREFLEEFARTNPVTEDKEEFPECPYCYLGWITTWPMSKDPAFHEPNCLWRRVKEYLNGKE